MGGSSTCAVWHADQQPHASNALQAPHAPAQVSAPIYRLAMTTLGGEQRFASAVARRLESLGALTRGDRRAASGVDMSESNLDSPLGRKTLRRAVPASLSVCAGAGCRHSLHSRPSLVLEHFSSTRLDCILQDSFTDVPHPRCPQQLGYVSRFAKQG